VLAAEQYTMQPSTELLHARSMEDTLTALPLAHESFLGERILSQNNLTLRASPSMGGGGGGMPWCGGPIGI
jgi:hypothetical protein